jgi:hypothetical protein
MFLGSKARPMRRADNLTAICEPLSRQYGILNISQPVTGIALLYVISARNANSEQGYGVILHSPALRVTAERIKGQLARVLATACRTSLAHVAGGFPNTQGHT